MPFSSSLSACNNFQSAENYGRCDLQNNWKKGNLESGGTRGLSVVRQKLGMPFEAIGTV